MSLLSMHLAAVVRSRRWVSIAGGSRRWLGIAGAMAAPRSSADVQGKPTPFNGQQIEKLRCSTPTNDLLEPTSASSLVERIEGSRFGIPFTVLFGGADRGWDKLGPPGKKARRADRKAVEAVIDEVFDLVDTSVNEWNPQSEASALNLSPAGVPINLSRPLHDVLRTSAIAHSALDGRFDPTVAPLSRAWTAALEQTGSELLASQVEDLLANMTGWTKLGFDEGMTTVTKEHEGVSLDLGGVAKGWAVDELLLRLTGSPSVGGLELASVLVEWGGDSKAAGAHPERGDSWKVGLARPAQLAELFARYAEVESADAEGSSKGEAATPLLSPEDLTVVNLPTGGALAVSGDATQARKFGFHHIVDTKTGRLFQCGTSAPALVAVEADSCALADAMATALMAAPDISTARAWLAQSARDGALPLEVRRVYAYCRGTQALVSFDPHVEGAQQATATKMRAAMRSIPAPVAVISSPNSDGAHPELAITATSVVSCSMEPPLLCFNIQTKSAAARALGPVAVTASASGESSVITASNSTGPLALMQLAVCYVGTENEDAVRRYATAAPLTAAEEASANHAWWTQAEVTVSNGRTYQWSCLRGAVASFLCEVRTVLPTGSSATVLAEVIAVKQAGGFHTESRAAADSEAAQPAVVQQQPQEHRGDRATSALLYQASTGYFSLNGIHKTQPD